MPFLLLLLVLLSEDKMKYYENLAEMYVGDDVSPDFYGWVFPKYDHVAVGTGERHWLTWTAVGRSSATAGLLVMWLACTACDTTLNTLGNCVRASRVLCSLPGSL